MRANLNGGMTAGLRSYAQVGIQTGVDGASPHRLILMLMDGALARIATAMGMLKRGDIAGKGESISVAISIINGLRDSLNLDQGGAIAENLSALYLYMCERLLQANLGNDLQALREVQQLLSEVRSGWSAIEPGATSRTDG
ncbi:MAG: flagellar export chaperone FliS [Gammaproteobacteria bacterium]